MFKSVYMKQVMFLFSIVIIFALIVAFRGSSVLEGNDDEMSVPDQQMSTEESVPVSAPPVGRPRLPGGLQKLVPGKGFVVRPPPSAPAISPPKFVPQPKGSNFLPPPSAPTNRQPPMAIKRPFMPASVMEARRAIMARRDAA